MSELIIGCGGAQRKLVIPRGNPEWNNPVTLDINPDHNPMVVHDLDNLPLPFADESFDEIHAYEVLEHCGRQGDHKYFFAQFEDFWRILKPGGHLCGSVPLPTSVWAWADPSHRRIIARETFQFLDQTEYDKQVGRTAMTDFRYLYKADFELEYAENGPDRFFFALRAVKPARIGPTGAA